MAPAGVVVLAALLAAPDPALDMVEGIKAWLRRTSDELKPGRPDRERLRRMIGAVDARTTPGLNLDHPALAPGVFAARWRVFDGLHAEGLYFAPAGAARCRAVVIPDADEIPEQDGTARALSRAGCEVLALAPIDRRDEFSGNKALNKWTNMPHREFVYRMSFPLGRHPLGYDVQKVLAAVDWLSARTPRRPLGVAGYGEGALAALYAAALDERIEAAWISGLHREARRLAEEPIYRNLFGLRPGLEDEQVAELVKPRTLIWDDAPGPRVDGPPAERLGRRGAAPGRLVPRGTGPRSPAALERALGVRAEAARPVPIPPREPNARVKRQLDEISVHTARLVVVQEDARAARFLQDPAGVRRELREDVLGTLAVPHGPVRARLDQAYRGDGWDGFDVRFEVDREIFGYGVLLVPAGLPPGERRAVMVVQHGLNGRPQHLFLQPAGTREREVYRNFAETLVRAGYIVYAPQNPYIHDFRPIARWANPLGLTLYTFITAQYERMLDWLATLPYADPGRIGFYGLSYGGKTALRIPPLDERFKIAVCAGDFNEWIRKLVALDAPYSYMFTHEYELLEWNLAGVASHAEMAQMMAPRPFLVERGHRDGVGADEWVAYEYAKVRRFYDERGFGDRTGIAFFNGPHRVDGTEALRFLERWLPARSR